MIPESRISIHMGVNFVVSPVPLVNRERNLTFQQALADQGIDFQKVDFKDGGLSIIREVPTFLDIRVAVLGPPVGQLVIVAPEPGRPLSLFAKEAEAVVAAFDLTWPQKGRQIVACDATLTDLFQTSGEHAFQELWETRLGQPTESLEALGRPVLGGGLRFVMPAPLDDPEQVQIEVKVESFLRDTKKFFVQTQLSWPVPRLPGESLDPQFRLEQVNEYVQSRVISFIIGGSQ